VQCNGNKQTNRNTELLLFEKFNGELNSTAWCLSRLRTSIGCFWLQILHSFHRAEYLYRIVISHLYLERFFVVLDGLEELPKVTLPEPTASRPLDGHGVVRFVVRNHAADALDDLEEEGGAIPHRLGKELQQDSFLVGIGQDAQLFQFLVLIIGQLIAQPVRELTVVFVARPFHQFEAKEILLALLHLSDGGKYVSGLESEVLQAGALVLLEVRLDLGLSSVFVSFRAPGSQNGEQKRWQW